MHLQVALALVWAVCAAQPAAVWADTKVPFSRGTPLAELPGASLLAPKKLVSSIDVTMTPATIEGPTGEPALISYTAPVYSSKQDGPLSFGPTLRVRAGSSLSIKISNNLTYGANPVMNEEGVFHDPFVTNVHIHGIHSSPGKYSQVANAMYTGGDNVFTAIPSRAAGSNAMSTLAFEAFVPATHMPGLHWYHPHHHGSSGLQTLTSNGLIIVEDDPAWLPGTGCAAVRNALAEAEDVMLHLGFLLFKPPQQAWPTANADLDDTDVRAYSKYSNPMNPLCCGNGSAGSPLPVTGLANMSNLVLVNGGLEPVIPMTAGMYQRWRLLHSGFKTFLDFQILDAATEAPSPNCELLLIAKDGLYLNQIPRVVDHIFVTSGNRAELLVRCNIPGDYILSAGHAPSPFGAGFASIFEIKQKIVATIKVTAMPARHAGGSHLSAPVTAGVCTPLRPDYASDLRDEALAAAGATDKVVSQDVAFTFGDQPYGCVVNDKNYTFPDPDPIVMPLGKVVEWGKFTYTSEHPLHVHVVPFQLVELPTQFLGANLTFTSWFNAGDWMDTLYLPMTGSTATQGQTVKIRMQPVRYAGFSVMHCHSLHHEDEGCMKVVEFACPGYSGTQPSFCRHEVPVPGTFKPSAKPPPSPKPPSCTLDGTYQITTQRAECTTDAEYLVYYGGNAEGCGKNVTVMRAQGSFKSDRSLWKLASGPNKITRVLTGGRGCADGENGLAGRADAANTHVVLAGKKHDWQVVFKDASCTKVNLVNTKRAAAGARAYLSSSTKCNSGEVYLASKDFGAGLQEWTLKKV